jgi:ssDNA-binding Zn-finger/Zn-ribbon topoisomerase 1
MKDRTPVRPGSDGPWSRIRTPGFDVCDGYPECRFEGSRKEVRLHMRECLRSDAGALYRVLRGSYGQ